MTTAPAVAAETDGEPDAKKSKTEETVTKTVKKAMTFVSLAEALKVRCCVLYVWNYTWFFFFYRHPKWLTDKIRLLSKKKYRSMSVTGMFSMIFLRIKEMITVSKNTTVLSGSKKSPLPIFNKNKKKSGYPVYS